MNDSKNVKKQGQNIDIDSKIVCFNYRFTALNFKTRCKAG